MSSVYLKYKRDKSLMFFFKLCHKQVSLSWGASGAYCISYFLYVANQVKHKNIQS